MGAESPSSEDFDEPYDNQISPAQLNLTRVYEQSRQGALNKHDAPGMAELNPEFAPKGKPRLLLMGQRR